MKAFFVVSLSALVAGGLAQTAPSGLSSSLASLVETERAFAKMSVDKGRRDAFLAFFGDDAIFFTPDPVNARRQIQTWPQAAPFRLDWEPHFGDIARAGDLGYTTGPFIRTSAAGDGKVLGTGWYFTVWKRQPDHTWKVAIDAGILSPSSGPLRPVPFTAAPGDDAVPAREGATSLLDVDRTFCKTIASAGLVSAFLTAGTDATRVYRDGATPMAGAAAIRAYFASGSRRMACEPARYETSHSADLGYTYGKYSLEGSPRQSGYYLRVWKQRAGQWKLAIDLVVAGS